MKTPSKPSKTRVASGFRALTLNTTGRVAQIPHTASSTPTMDYERKKKVAGLRSSPKRGKKMY